MSEQELIEEYIVINYKFTSNIDGWCIYDNILHKRIIFQRLVKDIERVFPKMDSANYCLMWWERNIKTITDKLNTQLNTYHLQMTNRGNLWSVVNHFGKEFELDELMKLVAQHHDRKAIKKHYDEWYKEELFKETKKLVNNL